jgi:hypothetical protein
MRFALYRYLTTTKRRRAKRRASDRGQPGNAALARLPPMPSRREQLYIGFAASAAFAIVVAVLELLLGLGWLVVGAVVLFLVLYVVFLLLGRRLSARRRSGAEPGEVVRIRLADPPDDTTESNLDWAHLSVTNDTDDNLPVTLSGSWGDKSTQFEWEPNGGYTFTLPPQRKARFAFVVRLRAGGEPFNYRGIQLVPGTCYVCDPNFHLSHTPGETLPSGQRTQIRVEAHPSGHATVGQRFDVYVPANPSKPLWVVPRGRSGHD